MYKKVKNIFYIIAIFIFIFLTVIFYFSDQNIKSINKSRALYPNKLNNDIQNLTLLKNDTTNIIEYRSDVEVYIKKKKNYTFWDLIKNN